ncbi:MAG TPA: molybdopterin biosynthesis protein [Methanospirillum sp.]|nr:molybdopterin biosynthesis protein [Methanospirillum sp.]
MKEGRRFLKLTPLSEALEQLRTRFSCIPGIITVPIGDSAGRITAEAIFSPLSVPSDHLSAMDGIAVRSSDTLGATDQKPVSISNAVRVNTGNLIPTGYDAVIMIEDAELENDSYIIRSAVSPWHHIRPAGEDIAVTEMILPRLHYIRPSDIGALAGYGIVHVQVIDLRVALIPTGSEIVAVGTTPGPGQVIESNMHMASALLRRLGVTVTHYPIVPDDPALIKGAVEKAVHNHDIVLISAGSSKGTKDYTAPIIDELGEVFIHGIAIKPAKPVILGDINKKPVIGIPGYPIACSTILREIITPLIGWYGFSIPAPDQVQARLTAALHSDIGTDEFVHTTVGKIAGSWVAVPLGRGSGVQMTMVRSNGYLKIPAEKEGIEAGEQIRVTLSVSESDASRSVLITGSHDPVIDHLADLARTNDLHIASSHVGSMGGLLALKRGDCHLAPMHLLDAEGEYNLSYLRKYLPGEKLVLICVAEREQGIVSRDTLTFDDITRLRYINRQRGSGTRMLLDHLLTEQKISSAQIDGYSREATTHLGVCLAVQNGDADLGMAVYSAAKAFGLAFIPVASERYELVTTLNIWETDQRIRTIADLIASSRCKEILTQMGGYRTGETGVIRVI